MDLSEEFSLKSHKLMLCRVDSLVPKTYFVHREFSFTLKDDVYLRYQSFADQQELEKEILKRNPYKIDIGAVFTHKVPSSVVSAFSSLFYVTSVSFNKLMNRVNDSINVIQTETQNKLSNSPRLQGKTRLQRSLLISL